MSIFDQWDIARFMFGALIAVCNFFVWRGVKLEELFIPWEKETGKRWLANALAWEFAFAMALLVVDTVGSIRQKYEIAALNAQIAPRRLLPDQIDEIGKSLSEFGSKSVDIASYALDVEGALLGFQVVEAFKKAHFSTNGGWLMAVQGGGPIALGIHVAGKDTHLVEAIIKAVGKYQVTVAHDPFSNGFITTGPNAAHPIGPPPDATIFVGVKPLAE